MKSAPLRHSAPWPSCLAIKPRAEVAVVTKEYVALGADPRPGRPSNFLTRVPSNIVAPLKRLALWTMPVAARVVGRLGPSARQAHVQMPAQYGRAAALDGAQHGVLI